MSPSEREMICDTIKTMGADKVLVNKEGDTVFVAYGRHGGCGRMHVNICNYLKGKLQGYRIVVVQMTKAGGFCQKARIREADSNRFHRDSIQVTARRLGLA